MKHMATMGLMLAFALPAVPAEPESPIALRNADTPLLPPRLPSTVPFGAAKAESWEDRKKREQERQERTDALPPQARPAAELCHEADAVMAMVVDVARMDAGKHQDEKAIVLLKRQHFPAAPAEVALKLSRLARNLRKEAKLWGSPCAP